MKDLQNYFEHKLFSKEEKTKYWGEGEWVDEPDVVRFIYKGISCEISRVAELDGPNHIFGGFLCGYCHIPKGHPAYMVDSEKWESDFDAYHGITYNEHDDKTHVIGFDCSHTGDIIPSNEFLSRTDPKFIEIKKMFDEDMKEYKEKNPDCALWNPTYKNLNFVIEECKNLAEQICESNAKID